MRSAKVFMNTFYLYLLWLAASSTRECVIMLIVEKDMLNRVWKHIWCFLLQNLLGARRRHSGVTLEMVGKKVEVEARIF
jgi:hypothetical protein